MRKHWLRFTIIAAMFLTSLGVLGAQEEYKSGPQVGKNLPGSFQAHNLNGRKGRDRLHCLVCEFQLNPVVLIFVREGKETDPKVLVSFLKKIEEKVKKYRKTHFLSSFVVFLTPDAKNAATEAKIVDPDELIKEYQKRLKFEERLQEKVGDILGPLYPESLTYLIGDPPFDWLTARVTELHPVVVTYMSDGPKGFDISPNPGITVVLYHKLKVEQVFAFPDGKLTEEATEQVLKGVDVLVRGKVGKKKG